MKIIAILAAMAAPFSTLAQTTTYYTCNVTAGYYIDDDEQNPVLTPNSTHHAFAFWRLETSYRDIYEDEGDYNMTSITGEIFTYTIHSGLHQAVSHLRPATTKLGLKATRYDAYLKGTSSNTCKLCGRRMHGTDEDADVGMKIKNLGVPTASTEWIAHWCLNLIQGPYTPFNYIIDCSIELSCVEDTRSGATENMHQQDEGETLFVDDKDIKREVNEEVA